MEVRGVVYNDGDTDTCYSDGMENSRKVLRTVTSTVLRCIESIVSQGDRPPRTVCIAEYGAADGGVSLELMNTAIDRINELSGQQTDIMIVYEDQLFNDFNVLFKRVHGMDTTLSVPENVHVLACATSMYVKCLPTGTVDLAFSSMAIHWLSKRPCHIQRGIFQSHCDDEELAVFRRQWRSDWRQFLTRRAQELRPGGYVVVSSFVTDDRGNCNDHIGDDSYDVFTNIWKGLLLRGQISEEEFVGTTSVTYHPTRAELLEPFSDDLKASLTLVIGTQTSIEIMPALSPSADETERTAYVEKCLGCIKPWLYNILLSGLSSTRSDDSKGTLLDGYFRSLRDILMKRRTLGPTVYRVANVVARRTDIY